MVLGTVCSTWVAVNSGTSGRTAATPDRCPEVPSVVAANRMVARSPSRTYQCYAAVVMRLAGSAFKIFQGHAY